MFNSDLSRLESDSMNADRLQVILRHYFVLSHRFSFVSRHVSAPGHRHLNSITGTNVPQCKLGSWDFWFGEYLKSSKQAKRQLDKNKKLSGRLDDLVDKMRIFELCPRKIPNKQTPGKSEQLISYKVFLFEL